MCVCKLCLFRVSFLHFFMSFSLSLSLSLYIYIYMHCSFLLLVPAFFCGFPPHVTGSSTVVLFVFFKAAQEAARGGSRIRGGGTGSGQKAVAAALFNQYTHTHRETECLIKKMMETGPGTFTSHSPMTITVATDRLVGRMAMAISGVETPLQFRFAASGPQSGNWDSSSSRHTRDI